MVSFMIKSGVIALAVAHVSAETGAESWDDQKMSASRTFSGKDIGTMKYFDANYMMGLVGTQGVDKPVVHAKNTMPTVALTAMEKVTSIASVSTRASIRAQLVDLLKKQVSIESMYSSKKEKLYNSASAVYMFISKLLSSACSIALGNDALWKEQMQCFSAYRQLLEVYAMWNGIRDVSFALEHGMAVSKDSLAVCGPSVVDNIDDKFVAQNPTTERLQNQYLVGATLRGCYDSLQVRIEALRRFLTNMMLAMDATQDRAESCLFRVITVLTCLSSGNQENILDLAIKTEHQQHTVYTLARYASTAIQDADNAPARPSAAMIEIDAPQKPENLREIRPVGN